MNLPPEHFQIDCMPWCMIMICRAEVATTPALSLFHVDKKRDALPGEVKACGSADCGPTCGRRAAAACREGCPTRPRGRWLSARCRRWRRTPLPSRRRCPRAPARGQQLPRQGRQQQRSFLLRLLPCKGWQAQHCAWRRPGAHPHSQVLCMSGLRKHCANNDGPRGRGQRPGWRW